MVAMNPDLHLSSRPACPDSAKPAGDPNDELPDIITEEEAAAARQIPSQLFTEVPPLIQLAQDTFRRDLPELLPMHYRQWVAYHGDRRLAFGRSATKLMQQCLARGIPRHEFMVLCVEPDFPYEDD
jgi:hypothetical protein